MHALLTVILSQHITLVHTLGYNVVFLGVVLATQWVSNWFIIAIIFLILFVGVAAYDGGYQKWTRLLAATDLELRVVLAVLSEWIVWLAHLHVVQRLPRQTPDVTAIRAALHYKKKILFVGSDRMLYKLHGADPPVLTASGGDLGDISCNMVHCL